MKNQLLSLTKTQKQKINYIIVVEFVEVKIIQKWERSNRSHRNKYKREKYANDETYRLAQKLRNRLRKALLKQLTQKNDKTEDLLGISFEEFKEYIEFLMTSDMRFDNIHLDHVKALKSFN